MKLRVNNLTIETTDAGFLADPGQWDPGVAEALAARESIVLTDAHWEIIHFIRAYYQQFRHLPNARMFTKAIRTQLGEDKGNTRHLYRLFPEGPLKFACKIAGLPQPRTCI